MLDFFLRLLAADFTPHAACLRDPGLVLVFAWANAAIAVAYYLIPLTLAYIVKKQTELAYDWMFLLFAVFILACGTTHVLDVYTLWHPVYRLQALTDILTAVASLGTCILLIRLVPQILRIPTPATLQREIRERRAAEDALRKLNHELERRIADRTAELERSNRILRITNEDLQQFAYVAAHDLQEPLRMLAVYSQVLQKRYAGQFDGEAAAHLEILNTNARQMSELVRDLLGYSQLMDQRNEGSLPVEKADGAKALETALTGLAQEINAAGAVLEIGTLPSVAVLPAHLVQVLQNLISNSLKYRSPERPLAIAVGSSPGDTAGFRRIFVRDNGIGIAPEYHARIFGVFKRLHGRSVPGTGIGLAICQKIAERYGGRIWVESEQGRGATFWCELPVAARGGQNEPDAEHTGKRLTGSKDWAAWLKRQNAQNPI